MIVVAAAYVIWDRASRGFVVGGRPLVFEQSVDAQAQADAMSSRSKRSDDSHRKPLLTYDVVTVTV